MGHLVLLTYAVKNDDPMLVFATVQDLLPSFNCFVRALEVWHEETAFMWYFGARTEEGFITV